MEFLETKCLLAVFDEDYEKLEELLSEMLIGELYRLVEACRCLAGKAGDRFWELKSKTNE